MKNSNGLFMMTVTSISPKNKNNLNFKAFSDTIKNDESASTTDRYCFNKSFKFIKDHQIFSLFAFDFNVDQ